MSSLGLSLKIFKLCPLLSLECLNLKKTLIIVVFPHILYVSKSGPPSAYNVRVKVAEVWSNCLLLSISAAMVSSLTAILV